jgi:hypothetical protein
MKDVKCTIKSAIKHKGAYYRGEHAATLEAVIMVPYQFGEFSGDLLIVDGFYEWTDDHYVFFMDKEPVTGFTVYGIYMLRDGVAYSLSRNYYNTAQDALNHALPRLGTPMIEWIASIDGLELHPACKEAVPA